MSAPLVATSWTHAGSIDAGSPSRFSLRERAEAVARAGFVGIGFTIGDLVAGREVFPWSDLRRLCDDLGLVHVEVEQLTDWWTDGERRARSDAVRHLLLDASQELRARQIKLAGDVRFDPDQPAPPPPDLDHWAGELHRVAAQAADVGTRVALEVLPMSNLPDFVETARLVTAADHPAAGLTVDTWHLERGPSTLADLATIPGELVFCVELDDAGPPQGDPYQDTMHHRRYCGQGDFDVVGFVRVVADLGFPGPWGVEIIADEHAARELDAGLADVVDTTTAVLQTAGFSSRPV
ncbi:sugar phosphate isomerase/epimerase [Nakamurella flava]|uniref:Sugar phosphate isomerase/epimerase n=1 Tax=Nakamurella flava TaxID=2576308 RepID=A0A4U6QIJ9_9ACTN|nr:sugar phosphate isomerase/epimerase [Nakamurella flava]TKV60227.1 sugar phosphate isomerase/epimerase [Nakamurella flava]